jgi:hypothetical protein
MICVLLGTTIVSDTRWMTLTDHAGAAPIVNVRPPRAREPARPVQGQSAILASTPTRTPATIQVRKPVVFWTPLGACGYEGCSMGREDIARNPRRFYKVIASVMGSINRLHLER